MQAVRATDQAGTSATSASPHDRQPPRPKGELILASSSASKNTYLSAKYRRIATRHGPFEGRGRGRARHAAHDLAHGHHPDVYDDPGADFYARLRPERAKQRAIKQLTNLGTKSPSTRPDEPICLPCKGIFEPDASKVGERPRGRR